MKKESHFINFLTLFFIFLTIFLIKYLIFNNTLLNSDQAFYSQWLSDMRAAEKIFPAGSGSFLQNILIDRFSFFHQLIRRVYNNFTTIFVFFPLLLNYLFGFIINTAPNNFNILSIIVNTSIPFTFLIIFKNKWEYINFKSLLFILLLILSISFNFSFFYYAPLGFHNFGILFLILTLYFSQKNFHNKIFFDKYFVLFGFLIPITCHSYNFLFVSTYLLILIMCRKLFFSNLNFKKDLIIYFSIILSFVLISIFFLVINYNNIFFVKGVLSLFVDKASFDFIELFNKLLSNTQTWLKRVLHYLGPFNLIVFLIFFYKFKNPTLLIAVFINYLLFIFLNLDGFFISIMPYNLIVFYFYFFFYITNVNFNFKNSYFNLLIILCFLLGIFHNVYKISYKNNLNISEKKFYNFYYQDNDYIKNNIFKIVKKIKNENIIFNTELTKNLFYSNYYSINNKKHIIKNDFVVNAHYNKFFKLEENAQNFTGNYNSLQKKNMILKNTYYLYFGTSTNNPLEKLCIIFSHNNYDCAKIEKIHLEAQKENIYFKNQQYKMILYYLN